MSEAMKIAVHLDASGRPVSLYEDGIIHLYDGAGDHWSKTGEFAYPAGTAPGSRWSAAWSNVSASRLGDCRTLVSGDRHGYVYSLLGQELGFACWTSEGSVLEEFFDKKVYCRQWQL